MVQINDYVQIGTFNGKLEEYLNIHNLSYEEFTEVADPSKVKAVYKTTSSDKAEAIMIFSIILAVLIFIKLMKSAVKEGKRNERYKYKR